MSCRLSKFFEVSSVFSITTRSCSFLLCCRNELTFLNNESHGPGMISLRALQKGRANLMAAFRHDGSSFNLSRTRSHLNGTLVMSCSEQLSASLIVLIPRLPKFITVINKSRLVRFITFIALCYFLEHEAQWQC